METIVEAKLNTSEITKPTDHYNQPTLSASMRNKKTESQIKYRKEKSKERAKLSKTGINLDESSQIK